MDSFTLGQSPFALVTFIVAPAMLTNASSVLAMSTINRMLRTRDRMSELYAQSDKHTEPGAGAEHFVHLADRVERQAIMLLSALRAIYVALGAFVAATLVTLLGALLEHLQVGGWFRAFIGLGLVLGVVGVSGVIVGCSYLFRTTKLSLTNITEEAALIRERQRQLRSAGQTGQL